MKVTNKTKPSHKNQGKIISSLHKKAKAHPISQKQRCRVKKAGINR